MSDYQVVNPATGEVEKEFPTATDAEIQDALARSHAAYGAWRTTEQGRAHEDAAPRRRPVRRARRRAGRDHRPRDGQAARARRKGELQLVASIYRYYADQGPDLLADTPLNPAMGGERAGPQGAGRPAARDHAVELPVLPGGPVRGAQPDDRQHDHAQARPAVPGVGARDGADLPRRRACPPTPTSTSSPPTTRRPTSSPTRAWSGVSVTGSERAGCRRRRGRRSQPQEGRARARRLRPVHRARRRRPRRRP